jgi:hypothetical protein
MDLLSRLRGNRDTLAVILSYLDVWTAKGIVRCFVHPADRPVFRSVLLGSAQRDRVASMVLHPLGPECRALVRALDRVLHCILHDKARSYDFIVVHGYRLIYDYLSQCSALPHQAPPPRVVMLLKLARALREAGLQNEQCRLCFRVVFLYLRRITRVDIF